MIILNSDLAFQKPPRNLVVQRQQPASYPKPSYFCNFFCKTVIKVNKQEEERISGLPMENLGKKVRGDKIFHDRLTVLIIVP